MKHFLICAIIILNCIPLFAQEQDGIVKTIGRPGKQGSPIKNVVVQADASSNVSLSDSIGHFSISLPHYKDGQAYSLNRVSKIGYKLADNNLIGRKMPYSKEIPVEISMVSSEDYNKIKAEIERQIRPVLEKEFKEKWDKLENDYSAKIISETEYKDKYLELEAEYNNIGSLIDKLADRYARTDYDRLDSLDNKINYLIENGKVDEAEQLILSKGTKKAYEELKESNRRLQVLLEEGVRNEERMRYKLADEYLKRFDIATMRCDNKTAANFLKDRMLLDTTNVEWSMDYAKFISSYLGEYEKALDIYSNLLKRPDIDLYSGILYGCIGNVYYTTGNYDKALENLFKSAEIREKDSSNLEDLALVYSNISSLYNTTEKLMEGKLYLEKAMSIYENSDDSLGIAYVYSSMAAISYIQGDFNKTEDYYNKSLRIRLSVLGDKDLSVASIYTNLAVFYKNMAKYDKALGYIELATEIFRTCYGGNHPETADCYIVKGGILLEQAKEFEVALECFNNALEIYSDFFNDSHPRLAEVYNKLGKYYSNVVNDFPKSLEYYKKAACIEENKFGKKHSSYVISMNNIAYVHSELGNYKEAIEHYNNALECAKLVFGENHNKVGDICQNIAVAYYKMGKVDLAIEFTDKAHNIFTQSYGESHPTVALTYSNLGSYYNLLKERERAIAYLNKSLEIYRVLYGENHPSVANIYDKIGCILVDEKSYEDAEAYLKKGCSIRESIYGDSHRDVASSYNNISQSYSARGKYAEAKVYLEKSLNILVSIFGENHPTIATIYSNIGFLYLRQNDMENAISFSKKSLEILEKVFDSTHPNVMLYKHGLADLYYKAGMFKEALPLIIEVYYNARNGKIEGVREKEVEFYFQFLHQLFFRVMADKNYSGEFDEEFSKIMKNTIIVAKVGKGSYAESIGLSGVCETIVYEDWNIADEKMSFFVHNVNVADKEEKSCVMICDGKYYPITFKGKLGVTFNPRYVSEEEKLELIKSYKKWAKKNKQLFK